MTNLRIIHDNAAARATITASSQAGALGPANLLTDTKSAVWRAASASASFSLAFPQPELIGGVILPFCNLTSAAMIRVAGYDARGAIVADSGYVPACGYAKFGQFDWGGEVLGVSGYRRAGVNQFSRGGGAYARCWLGNVAVRRLDVYVSDPTNPDGYIEASRVIAGAWWSPQYNADYGASVQPIDTSTQHRTDGGDRRVAIGARSRQLSLTLAHLTPIDRARAMGMLLRNGLSVPLFVSLFPDADDPRLEQDHQIYGQLSELSAVALPYFNTYSAPITIEEM